MAEKTKELIRPMPLTWFLRNPHLVRFFIRELSAFFVFGYAVFLLVMLNHLRQGTFHEFFENTLKSPLSILLHLVTLGMICYHSATSFNAAPTIMPVRIGEDKVNPNLIIGAHYVLWAVATVIVLVLAL